MGSSITPSTRCQSDIGIYGRIFFADVVMKKEYGIDAIRKKEELDRYSRSRFQ
jgi:hypothetical protein